MLSFTIGQSSISVFLDGEFNSIDNTHLNYAPLLEELKRSPVERNLDAIRTYIKIKRMIEVSAAGLVEVYEDEIRYGGVVVDNYMTQRMIELIQQGFDITPWARFMDNVFKNPAQYARDELYEWMEKADMPITPDGCFLAFKKVKKNYKDCHTGLFDNSPGTILEMDREGCDPVRDNHCSSGFHFCSVGYLSSFGGEVIIVVKINPEHVTSIPNDYGFTKGRTCRYEVIAELTKQSAAHHKCWKTGIVDLENPQELPAEVIKNIKFAPASEDASPVVVADSDPAYEDDNKLDITYHDGERIFIIRDNYQSGKLATVSYTDDDGNVWAHVDDVMGNVPKSGFGLKHKFDPANIRPLTPAETIEDDQHDFGKATKPTTSVIPSTRQLWNSYDVSGSAEAVARGDITEADRVRYLENCQKRYDKIFDGNGELLGKHTGLEYAKGLPPYKAKALTLLEQRDREFDAMVESGNFTLPAKATVTNQLVFETSDGRSFSADVIKAALEDASIRGAARNLGIQDSTLRGWMKKIG